MTLQQLEYIVAIDRYRHFSSAAEACFVTQPTLSMMVQKLEDEWSIKIFDRSKHPVVPTTEGKEIIKRAKLILAESKLLCAYVDELKGSESGQLTIAIIPTLAPYLLPLILQPVLHALPKMKITFKELTTEHIINAIREGEIDLGIVATPLHNKEITEHVLFYEEFCVYGQAKTNFPNKRYLKPKDLKIENLWLLEEGHCFRQQIHNLCKLKKQKHNAFHYEAGSIETLINLVDTGQGFTLIPKLAERKLTSSQQSKVHYFMAPTPVREISLISKTNFLKEKVLNEMLNTVRKTIPQDFLKSNHKKITQF